jgi:hypothetical protein
MSVLVYDGTSLAADSMANNGHTLFPYSKLWQTGATFWGTTGYLQEMAQLRQWVEQGLVPEQYPLSQASQSQLVQVSKEKGAVRYKGSALPLLHGRNKFAIGEGAPYAYGALFMGATAEQAVAAAIYYSVHCGGEPEVLCL